LNNEIILVINGLDSFGFLAATLLEIIVILCILFH
jgi:hypothetical protein